MLAAGTNSWSAEAMSGEYEEILDGGIHVRRVPGGRHETICLFLHQRMTAAVQNWKDCQLLAARTRLEFGPKMVLCPDLALLKGPAGHLLLAAEIISREDHRPDTVTKKEVYEKIRAARVWMVDPRYDNVEIYEMTQWGLVLKQILAGSEVLSDPLLPGFELTVADLFNR